MFISSYTTITILFLAKNFFSSNVYISVNTIFECSYLSFSSEKDHPLSMYVTRGMKGSKMGTGVYRGEGYHASCVRTHLHYLFLYFCLMVSCFICRILTLSSLKKGAFVKNVYFAPMRSTSIVMK